MVENSYRRYRPEHTVGLPPPKALRKEETAGEIEFRTDEFDEIPECNDGEHKRESETLHDVYPQVRLFPMR